MFPFERGTPVGCGEAGACYGGAVATETLWAEMAHIGQYRPDYGLDFEVKVVASSLRRVSINSRF